MRQNGRRYSRTGKKVIYVIDFCNKILSNLLRFFPAAFLLSLIMTLLYRKIVRQDRWISFFFFCIYLVLLAGETLWGRLGLNIMTEDFIGIGQLFRNPWYVAAAVENVIMFIPLGFLAVRVIPAEKAWQRCLIGAALTSGCIELTQYTLHIGEAQLIDILSNMLGAAVGIFLNNMFMKLKLMF